MVRFHTEWRASWNGHPIVVRNWWNLLLFTGEELLVDGRTVMTQRGWFRTSTNLMGSVLLDGAPTLIRVEIGQIDLGSRIGCRIFVNEELIGGDVLAKF